MYLDIRFRITFWMSISRLLIPDPEQEWGRHQGGAAWILICSWEQTSPTQCLLILILILSKTRRKWKGEYLLLTWRYRVYIEEKIWRWHRLHPELVLGILGILSTLLCYISLLSGLWSTSLERCSFSDWWSKIRISSWESPDHIFQDVNILWTISSSSMENISK